VVSFLVSYGGRTVDAVLQNRDIGIAAQCYTQHCTHVGRERVGSDRGNEKATSERLLLPNQSFEILAEKGREFAHKHCTIH
jgi:hypothetical protein